jgi:carbonic anhydrase
MIDLVYRIESGRGGARRAPSDWAAARRRLERGNRQFAAVVARHGRPGGAGRATRIIRLDPRNLGLGTAAGAPAQRPFAAVLGCADARVPIELVFGQAVNELFVVRLAGNVLGAECLGSLDYAVEHFGDTLRLMVVLGHGQCGAVTAAADAFLRPAGYLEVATSHPLRAIMDRLFIAVRGAAWILERTYGSAVSQRPGYRDALIDLAVVANVVLAAYSLQGELRARRAARLRPVYGVYDLATRHVGRGFLGGPGLAEPPADAAGFARLGARLAASAHVRRLLAGQGAGRA